MKKTFRGGVHPLHNIHEGKPLSNNSEIARIAPPERVVIPLSQHAGKPAVPIVSPGEQVKLGQLIAGKGGFVSANVHSSVSGRLLAIEERRLINGRGLCAVIENDGLDTPDPSIRPNLNYEYMEPADILGCISGAGVVGMGGAAFPLDVKLSPPEGTVIDYVILNGAECEPFLTIDSRTMVRHGYEVVTGLRLCARAVGAEKLIVAIEDNKPEAIACMKSLCAPMGIRVVTLVTKYPQGSEKQLIRSCVGREVPSGGLPYQVGVIVTNVATCFAVYNAVAHGLPLYESALTVSGCVSRPSNILVRIGTPFSAAIQACGGFKTEPIKVISGGPMMGIAVPSLDVPITKATSGILCLDSYLCAEKEERECIHCGKCVNACPMGLMPLYINAYTLREDFERAAQYRPMDCIECGACSYVCPAKRLLLSSIRLAKNEIRRTAAKKEGK